jgi:hypothetical protein
MLLQALASAQQAPTQLALLLVALLQDHQETLEPGRARLHSAIA